jgi:hypothetical protein
MRGGDEVEKGKQGSMIIKLRKDKKIVNDMFKQGFEFETAKTNPHIA